MRYWKSASRISPIDVLSQTPTALNIRSITHKQPEAIASSAIAMNGAWLHPPGSATMKAAAQLSTETPELVDSNRTTEGGAIGGADPLRIAGGIDFERSDIFRLLSVRINPDEFGRGGIHPNAGNRAQSLLRTDLG